MSEGGGKLQRSFPRSRGEDAGRQVRGGASCSELAPAPHPPFRPLLPLNREKGEPA